MATENRSRWIDVSVPLRDGMAHWPGDPGVSISRARDMDKGDTVNLSQVSMGAHTGTHMDAPLHFLSKGKSIDTLPLEAVMGRARVVEISDGESVKPEELTRHRLRRGERILFKTRNSPRVWQSSGFVDDFVYISDAAADYLVDRGVSLVGVDYLSVGAPSGGSYVHKTLLGGGIWLIEGLDLTQTPAGKYDLVCLPLKLVGGDGAPARAVLRPVKR
ncbi:MAG: cyclase family protein [Dehalococcoidales bacterium]